MLVGGYFEFVFKKELPRFGWARIASDRDIAFETGATEPTIAPSPLRFAGSLHITAHPR